MGVPVPNATGKCQAITIHTDASVSSAWWIAQSASLTEGRLGLDWCRLWSRGPRWRQVELMGSVAALLTKV